MRTGGEQVGKIFCQAPSSLVYQIHMFVHKHQHCSRTTCPQFNWNHTTNKDTLMWTSAAQNECQTNPLLSEFSLRNHTHYEFHQFFFFSPNHSHWTLKITEQQLRVCFCFVLFLFLNSIPINKACEASSPRAPPYTEDCGPFRLNTAVQWVVETIPTGLATVHSPVDISCSCLNEIDWSVYKVMTKCHTLLDTE